MRHRVVPQWNRRQQRQAHLVVAQEQEEEEGNTTTSTHVHTQNLNLLPNMSSKYEVAELTWENGQVAMHGLGQILPSSRMMNNNNDTLESIVHQATTSQNYNTNLHSSRHPLVISSSEWGVGVCPAADVEMSAPAAPPNVARKRMRESVSEPAAACRRLVLNASVSNNNTANSIQDDCASASATFSWANDTTPAARLNHRRFSLDESSRSLKTMMTTAFEEDSTSHGGSENRDEHETKSCISARRSRAAAVHNESERRRRDRINQKMRTLQKLVPNASKTDKASILDEVIEYLKQLQAQIQLMSTRNNVNMPQMMMPPPLVMPNQLHQMALMARMAGVSGSGLGMGMMDIAACAAANLSRNAALPPQLIANSIPTPPFLPPPPHFVVPPPIPKTAGHAAVAGTSVASAAANPVPFSDPYSAFLAQSMNMEFYNKMAALYRQQANLQSTQTTTSSKLQPNLVHGQDQ